MSYDPAKRSTLLGLIAILLWSTTIAFSRSLTEQLGTLTAAMLIYLLAGMIGIIFTVSRAGGLAQVRQLPRLYLVGCGALFVIYMVALYLAVGLASSRVQVLVVGLINYLWPGLSLVFSIPLLHQKARPALILGILLALAGVGLATTSANDVSWQALISEKISLLPYVLALVAAVSWGLYSNLSRRWAAGNDSGAVPFFLLASGLVLTALRLLNVETSHWSVLTGIELVYMSIFPGMLAYILWDIAVRKGEIVLVASLSYMTPLLSTLFSALVLNVKPGAALWLGAGLVIAGAVLCKWSVYEPSI